MCFMHGMYDCIMLSPYINIIKLLQTASKLDCYSFTADPALCLSPLTVFGFNVILDYFGLVLSFSWQIQFWAKCSFFKLYLLTAQYHSLGKKKLPRIKE